MSRHSDLLEEVQGMVNILGTGKCPIPYDECLGCQYEHDEVIDLMRIEVARADGNLCPTCEGDRWTGEIDPETRIIERCPDCSGSGIRT
jgi:hypothetical protein